MEKNFNNGGNNFGKFNHNNVAQAANEAAQAVVENAPKAGIVKATCGKVKGMYNALPTWAKITILAGGVIGTAYGIDKLTGSHGMKAIKSLIPGKKKAEETAPAEETPANGDFEPVKE